MHHRVAGMKGGPILELGAGTLNHRAYEDRAALYDVVEPFRELYAGRAESQQIRAFYDSVERVPESERYHRIISIAVLEHMENLPREVAGAALRLNQGGVFQAGIPSEGGMLWGAAWRLSTAISYYLRTGLSYAVVMRHEHINSAPEIISIVKYLFSEVRLWRFPLPSHHLSLYTYLEARRPNLERCHAYATSRGRKNE